MLNISDYECRVDERTYGHANLIIGICNTDHDIELHTPDVITLAPMDSDRNVMGNANFSDCINLYKLPDGYTFHKDLRLSGCKSFRYLPHNTTIRGNLYLDGTAVEFIPRDMRVRGKVFVKFGEGYKLIKAHRFDDNITVEYLR